MSVKNRVIKLEEKSDNKFKVAIVKGEFFDKHGEPISKDGEYPQNLQERVHSAIVGVSDSDETVTLELEEGETGAEFMRRFDQVGNRLGQSAGATVTLRWDVKWI